MITDLRFAQFRGEDEANFVKDNSGIIIHVEKFNEGGFSVLEPANEEESINDPKVKALADYKFRWHHFSDNQNGEILARLAVEDFLGKINRICEK